MAGKIRAVGPGNGIVSAGGLNATAIDTALMPGEGPVHVSFTLEGQIAPCVWTDLPRGTIVLIVAPEDSVHVRPSFKATPRPISPPASG